MKHEQVPHKVPSLREFRPNKPEHSDPDYWNIDLLSVRQATYAAIASYVQKTEIEPALHLTALTFQGNTLWAVCPELCAVVVFDAHYESISPVFGWEAGEQVTDIAYDARNYRLLFLDAPAGVVRSWEAFGSAPTDIQSLTQLDQWSVTPGPLPAWSRMSVWYPDATRTEVLLTGLPGGGLIRKPLRHEEGSAVLFQGRDPLLSHLVSGPYSAAGDDLTGQVFVAGAGAPAVFVCTPDTGEVTRICGSGQTGSGGDGEHPLSATFQQPADLLLYRYRDRVDRGFLTTQSAQQFEEVIREGTDRCLLIADCAADRVRKWIDFNHYRTVLTLAGGGTLPLARGRDRSVANLLGHAVKHPTRMAISASGILAVLTDGGQSVVLLRSRSGVGGKHEVDQDSDN